jgi:hypothetical protein
VAVAVGAVAFLVDVKAEAIVVFADADGTVSAERGEGRGMQGEGERCEKDDGRGRCAWIHRKLLFEIARGFPAARFKSRRGYRTSCGTSISATWRVRFGWLYPTLATSTEASPGWGTQSSGLER